jgi:hypothetical protein
MRRLKVRNTEYTPVVKPTPMVLEIDRSALTNRVTTPLTKKALTPRPKVSEGQTQEQPAISQTRSAVSVEVPPGPRISPHSTAPAGSIESTSTRLQSPTARDHFISLPFADLTPLNPRPTALPQCGVKLIFSRRANA